MSIRKAVLLIAYAALAIAMASSSRAGDRLAWTGGVDEFEGSAGGGLVPWALIGGLGTRDQVGASAFATRVSSSNFSLQASGLNVGLYDRLELSFARQRLDAGAVVPGLTLGQNVWGVKLKLAGDAVFAPDEWLPQIAAGGQFKDTLDYSQVPQAVGARHGQDVDLYVSATKLYFGALAGRNVLLNATLRRTRADQFGLLGFGGVAHGGYALLPELSAGVWVSEELLAGAEYRAKPSDLAAFREDDVGDLFLAWNPLKDLTITAAFVDLGRIAGKPSQQGWYASLWLGI